jgi:hypothetical protein
MAMRVYATATRYGRLAEDAFEDAGDDNARLNKRLRSASIEVEKMVRMARYSVDEDGYPTDANIAEGFEEATCAIVEYWEETGDHTGADAHAGAVRIGSVSLGTTSSGADSDTARDKLIKRIGEKAVTIIDNLGLSSGPGY